MKSSKLPSLFPLQAYIQHYDWGGTEFIPRLLNIPNPQNLPYAEMWMGAHPRGPAKVLLDEEAIPLSRLIARNPEACLGKNVARRFDNQLPFLFKVLDVHNMLSIQAHPSKRQAVLGYRQENERGIPLDAPNRLFKDANHKPEVMVALSDFWLLHGFRSKPAIEKTLRQMEGWSDLLRTFGSGDAFSLYRYIMEMPQAQVDQLLKPLAGRLRQAVKEGTLSKSQPEFWAARAFENYGSLEDAYDRGIFSIFLFNLVHLKKGEGIFQDAGIPHAYLEGVNVELMANSDNVFRGGLTKKHVDKKALMQHLVFDSVKPSILKGKQKSATERIFPTPAPDFQLSRIQLAPGMPHRESKSKVPEIYLILEGHIRANERWEFERGNSFYVNPGHEIHLQSREEAVLFKASVPE